MFKGRLLFFLFILHMATTLLFSQKPVYMALGDSYTICEGLAEHERWPNLIEARLVANKYPISLAQNLSRTGYTTDDLIKYELPLFKTTLPNIVSILIGVNDYVRGYDTSHFHKNLTLILDDIQNESRKKTKIILLTIPDYSVTPAGAYYANGRDVAKDLGKWNDIIKNEARNREIILVDIFPTTQKMKDDESLISSDQLHPSAKEVAIWAELIYPEMEKIVKTFF